MGQKRKKKIKASVLAYANKTKDAAKYSQSGRVWFLVKKTEKCSEVLQVAQALDYNQSERYFVDGYFDEITSHIDEMFSKKGGKYKDFANNIRENGSLVFYELAIDKYLEEFAPVDYKDAIYKIARDYYAEALLAHYTQAREWGYWNSGMDKRAYYNILENLNEYNQIDKQEGNQKIHK